MPNDWVKNFSWTHFLLVHLGLVFCLNGEAMLRIAGVKCGEIGDKVWGFTVQLGE